MTLSSNIIMVDGGVYSFQLTELCVEINENQ